MKYARLHGRRLPLIAGALSAFCAAAIAGPPPMDARTLSVGIRRVTGPGGVPLLEGPAVPKNAPLVFSQIAADQLVGQVANGTAFDLLRLPATFKATLPDGMCTATLIGPRVLLTAAHCLDTGTPESAKPRAVPGGIRLNGEVSVHHFRSCELAPAYVAAPFPFSRTPRNAKDWALCEMSETIDVPHRETLSLDPAALTAGVPIMVAGFGCTGLTFVNGMMSGDATSGNTLTAGENRLAPGRRGGWAMAVGRLGGTGAIICPGDSGGAAFIGASVQPGHDVGWRVFATNSAVGPSDAQAQLWRNHPPADGAPLTGADMVSYFAVLSDPDFRAFVTQFQARRRDKRQICGVDLPPTGNCRS